MAYGKVCNSCGHNNRIGVMFCENCGEKIVTGSLATVTQTRMTPEALLQMFHNLSDEEKSDTLKVLQEARDVVQTGMAEFDEKTVCKMLVENSGETFDVRLKPDDEVIFGRVDLDSHNYPDVDLIPYGGYQLGISRIHAGLSQRGKALYLRDLDSSNGTMINDVRIAPNQVYQVRDGDRIRLGKLVLRVNFVRNEA